MPSRWPASSRGVLHHAELLRLDFGVLTLHMLMTALFLVVPLDLKAAGAAGGPPLVGLPAGAVLLGPGHGPLHHPGGARRAPQGGPARGRRRPEPGPVWALRLPRRAGAAGLLPVPVLHRLQPPGGEPALADLAHSPGGGQGDGHGGLCDRPVRRGLPRRHAGWLRPSAPRAGRGPAVLLPVRRCSGSWWPCPCAARVG